MTRQAIGGAIVAGIVSGILIDTWKLSNPSTVVYARYDAPKEVLIEAKIDWTKERINREIEEQAEKYGVSAAEMKRVIKCESNGSTTIQSFHTKNGVREESYGLAQIHLPSHTSVTKEEAVDPKFAIDFMAKHFAEGSQELWSCY